MPEDIQHTEHSPESESEIIRSIKEKFPKLFDDEALKDLEKFHAGLKDEAREMVEGFPERTARLFLVSNIRRIGDEMGYEEESYTYRDKEDKNSDLGLVWDTLANHESEATFQLDGLKTRISLYADRKGIEDAIEIRNALGEVGITPDLTFTDRYLDDEEIDLPDELPPLESSGDDEANQNMGKVPLEDQILTQGPDGIWRGWPKDE